MIKLHVLVIFLSVTVASATVDTCSYTFIAIVNTIYGKPFKVAVLDYRVYFDLTWIRLFK